MMRLGHNSKNIDSLRFWGFFPSVKLIKTMWLTPSNSLFVCMVHVLWPIWISSKIGVILSVKTFTWKSHVLEFSQTNWLYRLKEKSLMHLGKLFWRMCIAISSFLVFDQTFFHFFQTSIFGVSVFWDLPSGFLWVWYLIFC